MLPSGRLLFSVPVYLSSLAAFGPLFSSGSSGLASMSCTLRKPLLPRLRSLADMTMCNLRSPCVPAQDNREFCCVRTPSLVKMIVEHRLHSKDWARAS